MGFLRQQSRRWLNGLSFVGIEPGRGRRTLGALPWYFRDLQTFKKQQGGDGKDFPITRLFPILQEKYAEGGISKGPYFFQDLLVAQKIYANAPEVHMDVGSRIDGFIAHVASFREIELLDIRQTTINVPNIKFRRCDLMAEVDPDLENCCDSLSCLHALEHFGLGRYGDPIAYDGHIKGFNNLYKILRPSGKFYFSVPFGPQRVEFNAHRVFSMEYLLGLIENKYQIDSFSYVNDPGNLCANVPLVDEQIKTNYGCQFGCAIFELTKL